MKHYLLIPLLLFKLIVHGQLQVTNVLYGERDQNRSPLSICFDKNGDIYPNYLIIDTSLKMANSSLSEWYLKHPSRFEQIAQLYNCTFKGYSGINVKTLNDSIIANISRQINSARTLDNSLTMMIHGFRKPFKDTLDEYTSQDDFKTLEGTISKFGLPSFYLEIYWDAMYGCCFGKNAKRNKVLFSLFETAQQNAIKVGKQLRKLLLAMQFDNINVVSHSLGAKVATEALFNTSVNQTDETPSTKQINVCLIAPAIAGVETFKTYYNRNSKIDFQKEDNYRLAIVYNENDFVLKKRDNRIGWFGPGPYNYGNTTLGCNYDGAASNLRDYFETNYPNSTIKLFNLSNVGGCHYLGQCYCDGDNLKDLVGFMK